MKTRKIFYLIFLAALLTAIGCLVQPAFAYTQGTPEQLREARNLTFAKVISKISSGGIGGNLGNSLMLLAVIFPSLMSLYAALRYRHALLKVVQFPALISILFGFAVFFLQPERWITGTWAEEYCNFTFFVGLGSGIVSSFLLYQSQWPRVIWVLGSVVFAFIIYAIRSVI